MSQGFQNLDPLPRDPNAKEIQGTYRLVGSGNATVTATVATQISGTSTACKRLDISANASNTDVVVVGGSTVIGAVSGRKGVVLQPSATYTLYPSDLSDVYIDGPHTGDTVSYAYFS